MARIFITGSADGLGRLAAEQLTEDGHQVVVHARTSQRLTTVRDLLDRGATAVVGDLSDPEQTRDVAAQVNRLGSMDAVIHNAGVMSGPVLAVNVVAPYLLTALIERPQRLIYLSSSMHRGGRVSLANIEWNGHSGSYSDSKLLVTTLAMAVARLWARSSTSNSRSTRPPRATARWTSATRSRCSCGREPVGRPSRPFMKRFTGIGRATEGGRPMQITRDIETQKGPADWFTGDVYIDGVAAPAGTSTFAAALVHFTPGARTAWHTHPHGQTIFVTEGVGLCQREGGPIETIRPGDRVFFEPGENHWHGAAANRFMVHIAMQQNDESGSPVTWGEHVADEQYGAARAEG